MTQTHLRGHSLRDGRVSYYSQLQPAFLVTNGSSFRGAEFLQQMVTDTPAHLFTHATLLFHFHYLINNI